MSVSKERTRRATIYTIAEEAGVSHTTVSHVLNGRGKVSDANRARITEIAARQGFVAPNHHARALRTSRSQLVGLLLSDLTNPYYGELARSVDQVLRAHRHACLVSGCDADEWAAQRVIAGFLQSGVDAVISTLSALPSPLTATSDPRFPVFICVSDEPVNQCSASVYINVWHGMVAAVGELVAMGHRKIVYLGSTEENTRFKAYATTMKSAGLSPAIWRCGELEAGGGRTALQQTVQRRVKQGLQTPPLPTAIVAHDDFMALAALQTAQELGIHVPGQLSLIGTDDTLLSRLVTPRLSTLSFPIAEIGKAAAILALERAGIDIGHELGSLSASVVRVGERSFRQIEYTAVPVWRESTASPWDAQR